MKCGALILAAGNSHRFGSDKRQALVRGVPLLNRTLAPYVELGLSLIVVTSPSLIADQRKRVEEIADVVTAPDIGPTGSKSGMGDSLALGVRRAVCLQWDAVLIGLGDMPLLQTSTLSTLRDSLCVNTAVVPEYEGRWGHPVGFQKTHFSRLMALQGEKGAKSILQAVNPKTVKVADKGVILDIDTPLQLVEVLKMQEK